MSVHRLDAVLLFLVAVAAGCRGLRIANDRLLCGANNECPAPYRCNPEGRCALPHDAAAIDVPDMALDQLGPDAGKDEPHDAETAPDASEGGTGRNDAAPGQDVLEAPGPVMVLLSVAIDGPAGVGSVLSTSPGVGINCGSACSALVTAGSTVQLAAAPSANGSFAAWTGCSPSNLMICSVIVTAATNVTASFKLKPGAACGQAKDCSTTFCVSNICCASACNGACDASCQSGTCSPQPARTPCGKKAGPGGSSAGTDIALFCDGAGKCGAPVITCSANTGDVPCNLTTMACCGLPPGITGGAHMTACAPAASCSLPGDGDFFSGYSCAQASDCPLGQSCCYQTLANGGHWAICKVACNTVGGDVPLP